MRANWLLGSVATLAAATCALVATRDLPAQGGSVPPKARYMMDVSTTSGFSANPMAAMFGRGGSSETHDLVLRLGSTLPATGAPQADHFMPDGMRLGPSVPLQTPQPTAGTYREPEGGPPEQFRKPKRRLLLFWGCGAHARPGQPVVLDFAKLAAGQAPPRMPFSTAVPVETGPTTGNSRTYGTWPNSMGKKQSLPKGASLIGQHRVAGNYSPEIAFGLTQDFMPGLQVRNAAAPDGSILLSWNPVAAATGYYALIMGAKDMGNDNADMVWWTSASRQEFGAGLTDWLSPATVGRLIGQQVVMPPSQTSCQVPAEVKQAAGGFMMNMMTAYGPEQEFAYPPRPANPKLVWRPDWIAKARFRSTAMTMIGMPGMGDMAGDEETGDANPRPKRKKCKTGGLLGGALGLPTGC